MLGSMAATLLSPTPSSGLRVSKASQTTLGSMATTPRRAWRLTNPSAALELARPYGKTWT